MKIVWWQFRQSRVDGYGLEGPQSGIVRRQGLKSGCRVGDHPADGRRRPLARRRFGENNPSRVPSDVRTNRRRIPAAFHRRRTPIFPPAISAEFSPAGSARPSLSRRRPNERKLASAAVLQEKGAARLRTTPPVGLRSVLTQPLELIDAVANKPERTPCGRSAYANRRGRIRDCITYPVRRSKSLS